MAMLVITRGYIPTSQGHGQLRPSLIPGEGFDLPGKLWRGSVSDLDDGPWESQCLRSGVSLDWFKGKS